MQTRFARARAGRFTLLGAEVDPFGAIGAHDGFSGGARQQMHVGVCRFDTWGNVDESGVEAGYGERLGDAHAQLAEHFPDHALLLHVEIVECGHVSSRRDDHMAGCGGVRRGNGNSVLVGDPGVFGGRGAIRAVGQTPNIAYEVACRVNPGVEVTAHLREESRPTYLRRCE